jgi:hypothetical protein
MPEATDAMQGVGDDDDALLVEASIGAESQP